jgi:aspartate kinase
LIVLKFGGSSVRDSAMIRSVIAIAKSRLSESPLLVASAMGDTTDILDEIADEATRGNSERAFALVDSLEESHRTAAAELTTGERLQQLDGALTELLSELRSLIQGIFLIRECSPRSRDAALSFGERLSTAVITAAAREAGIDALFVDARSVIRTNSDFGAATPDPDITADLAKKQIEPEVNRLVVTGGFIASDAQGVTTTLGRGGSDYTATILGAALGAAAVEIWTDVNGIMTADPRVIPGARSIRQLSYDEAAELAYFGARVVHPFTILPAVRQNIPVYVKNTTHPADQGTEITEHTEFAGIRAMASKSGITLVTVQSSRMLNAYGFLQELFAVFGRHAIPVDLVATSEVSVSLTIDRGFDRPGLVAELKRLGHVTIEDGQSIVCLVGRELIGEPGFLADVFASLKAIPVRMISLGSSDINLSLVLAEEHTRAALEALHDRFIG